MHKILDYIRARGFDQATLVLDLDEVQRNFVLLRDHMPTAHIHYAVKANPHPQILQRLVQCGSRFDAASRQEIADCVTAGANPQHISFGNTVKHSADIAWAAAQGIDLFCADAEQELEKLAQHAPGCRVYLRVRVSSTEAEWPLSRKFGCDPRQVLNLLDLARDLGLRPVGLSFHVGSQVRHPHMWTQCLDIMSGLWSDAQIWGHELSLLNIGGGFPAAYGRSVTPMPSYCAELMAAVRARFDGVSYLMAEPGRAIVASAGMIAAECLLVSRKYHGDDWRWVYLNIGRFSGLAETEGEAIRYQFTVLGQEHCDTAPCILAGPSCDSADVLYETHMVDMPVTLSHGDRLVIHACGAYTSTYSSVAFNGFAPLAVVVIH